jgi:putative DNA primase/helicase
MLILQMTNSFLGREDRTLDGRLRAELPGILNWALDGLDRLTERGRFTVPKSSDDATALMADLASPMSAFVRDTCVLGPDENVPVDDLYFAWKQWAFGQGHHAGAKSTFGRNLVAAQPTVKVSRPRIGDAQVRYYVGIGIRTRPRNALPPDSPDSGGEVAGQAAASESGDPDSNDATKARVNGVESVESGESGTLRDVGGNGFVPPIGPDRCDECGWHVETQGHEDGCRQTVAPSRPRPAALGFFRDAQS